MAPTGLPDGTITLPSEATEAVSLPLAVLLAIFLKSACLQWLPSFVCKPESMKQADV